MDGNCVYPIMINGSDNLLWLLEHHFKEQILLMFDPSFFAKLLLVCVEMRMERVYEMYVCKPQ